MSAEVISRSPDLKRLQDEGYELEVKLGHAIIYNVPYLDSNLQVQYGTLVSPLDLSGETAKYTSGGISHVVYFKGQYPYRSTGEQLQAVVNSRQQKALAGVEINYMFSNKPSGGYKDYYDKFVNYINILSNEARVVCPTVTATTFKRIVSVDSDVMVYSDTNASRAAISHLTDKFRNQKVAIIGLGGTGSYILDQVAKTPVAEIHLFDGDVFCQHNAFRAPGAACVKVFEKQPLKTDYFASVYSNMHKNVISHPYAVTSENITELSDMTYVFIAMDSGESKRIIVEWLISNNIYFVDTGIDVQEVSGQLLGTARVTEYIEGKEQLLFENISFVESEKGLYDSNIQTSELNAFCAITAVIQWKKRQGFYLDCVNKCHCIYDTSDGEFK